MMKSTPNENNTTIVVGDATDATNRLLNCGFAIENKIAIQIDNAFSHMVLQDDYG